ncbi:hypothetical protein BURK1_03292 [Burkholderiales bacterium]|nr:hypothetical protein BURK1_03292 [Burkholderiales bacterium]
MLALARDLAVNLAAGLRLALMLPVRRLAFRVGPAALIALLVISAAVQIGTDAVRYGEGGAFSWYGLGSEVLSGGLLLLTATILALAFRDPPLALAVPVIVLASFPVLQVANAMPWQRLGVPRVAADALDTVVLAWIVAVLVRAVHVALEHRRSHRVLRAIGGGLLLAAPILYAPAIAPIEPWFAPLARDEGDSRHPNPASEPVLALQATILDHALDALEDGRPGRADLYFVGFAGDATEDAFRRDVEAAQRVMDERWGTEGRSLALVNSTRTLLSAPMATLTHLRAALDEIAAAMDADEDVVMVYVATTGSPRRELEVHMPGLELVPLTPELLKSALDDAGIRHRIVVISACHAGGFLQELADDDTVVIVAAQSDASPHACDVGSDATLFGDAFFRQGMATANGVAQAFDVARASVEARELAQGLAPPATPQMRIGPGIAARLPGIERRGGAAQREARRSGVPAV